MAEADAEASGAGSASYDDRRLTEQSAIDFWSGVLGMPFIMEQPNLGKPDENNLYFDPGDGRLLTVFTSEARDDAERHAPRDIGCVEHLAFNVSRATGPPRQRDATVTLDPIAITSRPDSPL